MPENDEEFYERAVRRITRNIVVLGLVGTVATAFLRGPLAGLAFLIGATASYFSFWGWQQVAAAITGGQQRSPRYFVFRLLAIIALAWVIMRFLKLSVAAVIAGLLVTAAALLLETIYELIYAS